MIRAGMRRLASRRRSSNAAVSDSSATTVATIGSQKSCVDVPRSSIAPWGVSATDRSPPALDACESRRGVDAGLSAFGACPAPSPSRVAIGPPKESARAAPAAFRDAPAATLLTPAPPKLVGRTSATMCASAGLETPPVLSAPAAGAPASTVVADKLDAGGSVDTGCSAVCRGAGDDLADVTPSLADDATGWPPAAEPQPVPGVEIPVVAVSAAWSPAVLVGEWTAPPASGVPAGSAGVTVCAGSAAGSAAVASPPGVFVGPGRAGRNPNGSMYPCGLGVARSPK